MVVYLIEWGFLYLVCTLDWDDIASSRTNTITILGWVGKCGLGRLIVFGNADLGRVGAIITVHRKR